MLQIRKLRLRGERQASCPRPAGLLRFQPRSQKGCDSDPGPVSPPATSGRPSWNEKAHNTGRPSEVPEQGTARPRLDFLGSPETPDGRVLSPFAVN